MLDRLGIAVAFPALLLGLRMVRCRPSWPTVTAGWRLSMRGTADEAPAPEGAG